MKKTVLITGATAGFGEACAYTFARAGHRLMLNGRREDRLKRLQSDLSEKFATSSYLLPFDVQDQSAVFNSIENLPPEWQDIDILVNNAGLALGRDLFDEASLDDWNTMLDTNV